MKKHLIALTVFLLFAETPVFANSQAARKNKTTTTERTTAEETTEAGVKAESTTVATAQVVEEESPALDKTLGRRGAIQRRMEDAAERRRMARESTNTVSGTVTPRSSY